MILTLDVGNSNINLGGFCGETLRFTARLLTAPNRTEVEYAVLLRDTMLLYKIPREDVTGAILSSVVPPLTPVLGRAIQLLFGLEAMVLGPGIRTGLNIRIDNPAQLGADLVASAVGAIESYPLPAVVVDLGTATKLSVIDGTKTFIGASILPGVQLSLDALSSSTAQLPRIGLEEPVVLIGTNTIDSMKSGVILGAASMIDGMLDRLEERLGTPFTALACGGLAPAIIRHCRRELRLDQALILSGLHAIYKKNQS